MRVEGLETLDYFDNLMQKERYTEQADAITFDGEVCAFAFETCSLMHWNPDFELRGRSLHMIGS